MSVAIFDPSAVPTKTCGLSRFSQIQSDLTDPATSDTVCCEFALAAATYNLLQFHCGCLNAVPRSEKATGWNTDTHTQQGSKRKHLLQESPYNSPGIYHCPDSVTI